MQKLSEENIIMTTEHGYHVSLHHVKILGFIWGVMDCFFVPCAILLVAQLHSSDAFGLYLGRNGLFFCPLCHSFGGAVALF